MIVRELLASFGLDVKGEDFQKADKAVDGLKRSASMLAGVFAAGGLALGMRKLVLMASDAAETVNVLSTSFNEYQADVERWADGAAASIGRSRYELREFAGQMGAILTPMLGSAKASAEMSTSLSELSLDLASFFNTAEPDALQALQSALVGQARPLMRYGVVLNEATLAQFLLSEGITKSTRDMTTAELTAVRYRFIMQATSNAQGDATRTATGYANSSKALKGQIKDLGTEIGMKLLPGATRMVRLVTDLIRKFRDWTEGTKTVETAMGALTIVIGALGFVAGAVAISKIGALAIVLGKAALGAKALGTAALLAQVKMFAIGLAALAVVAVIALVAEDLHTFFTGGESLVGKFLDKWDELVNRIRTGDIDPNAHWLTLLLFWLVEKVTDFGAVWMKAQDWWLNENTSLIGDLKMLWQDWITIPLDNWKRRISGWIGWLKNTLGGVPGFGFITDIDTAGGVGTGSNIVQPVMGPRTDVPASIAQPVMGPRAGAGAGASQTVVNAPVRAEINITQLPGESGEDLATRVDEHFEQRFEIHLKQALAATGGS